MRRIWLRLNHGRGRLPRIPMSEIRERLLIIGKSGRLSRALGEILSPHYDLTIIGRVDLDKFTDFAWLNIDLEKYLRRTPAFKAVINCMALNGLEQCQSESAMAFYVNAQLPAILAHLTNKHNIPLIHFSSDYAIAGYQKDNQFPFEEFARVGKHFHAYGLSKRLGEETARINPRHLIFRLSSIYTKDDLAGALGPVKQFLNGDKNIKVLDQICAPTSTRTIAEAIEVVLKKFSAAFEWWGTFHISCSGNTTKKEFGEVALRLFLNQKRTLEIGHLQIPRPKYCLLSTAKFEATFNHVFPCWETSLLEQALSYRLIHSPVTPEVSSFL